MGFIGDLFGGGKGGSAPPAPTMPQQDFSGLENMMAGFENMMMGAMGSIAQAQMAAQQQQADMMATMNMNMPSLPEAVRDPIIDWTEQQEKLSNKARADYSLDQARRKGRQDTILTSPLLDDEEPNITGSVLAEG